MSRYPLTVKLTLSLIGLNAAIWFVYAIIVTLGGVRSFETLGLVKWIMALLALGVSVFLAGLIVLLMKRVHFAFYASGVFLMLVVVLSITDEIGLPDLFTALISLAALGLLLKERGWYLQSKEGTYNDQAR